MALIPIGEAAFEPPRFTLLCLLAGVHLSVVKLDLGTGRAVNAVSRLVVIPPAVVVPGAARVVGPHCVVRGATN
jgi:hypothetical protein